MHTYTRHKLPIQRKRDEILLKSCNHRERNIMNVHVIESYHVMNIICFDGTYFTHTSRNIADI